MYSKAFHLVKHTPSGSFHNTLMEGLTVHIVLKLMALKYCITQTKFTVFKPTQKGANSSQSNQLHSYNTSNSQAYRRPYCRTNTKKFSPFLQGPTFFNSLQNEVINSQSFSSFKKLRKIKLLRKHENRS